MTAPVPKPSASSQSASGLVETLYNHPNVKIIAFTASGRNRARSPGRAPADEKPGSLPSSSQLERTIAVVIETTPTPPSKTTRRKSESPAARQLKASMEATTSPEEKAKMRNEAAQAPVVQQSDVQELQAPKGPAVSSVAEEGKPKHADEALKQQNAATIQDNKDEKKDVMQEEVPATLCSPPEDEPEPAKVSQMAPETSAPETERNHILVSKKVNDESVYETGAPASKQSRDVLSEVETPLAREQMHTLREVCDTAKTQSCSSPTLFPVKEAEDRWEESPPLTAILRKEPPSVSVEVQAPEKAVGSTPRPTKTPRRPDIHDFIRSYEQKAAAEVSTSVATVTEPIAVVESIAPLSAADDESRSNASEESGPGAVGEEEASAEVLEGSGVVGTRRKKLRGFRAGRSLAVPPQLTLITSPPSKSAASKQSPTGLPEDARGPISPAGSSDSFHSVQSWQSPLSSPGSQPKTPSTFPYPHDNILMPMRMSQYRDISDLTVTPDTKRTWDAVSCATNESSQESAATAPDMASEIAEQAGKDTFAEGEAISTAMARRRPSIRHRATTSSISVSRALSPLPPAANLFSPTATSVRRLPTRSRLDLVRRVPMAIVAKTCEILLSPPSHLMNLMLRVAARIAAGEWRGMMFGYGESGETIPVQWDYSDGELSDWGDDDDFYMSQAEGSRATSVVDPQEAFDLTGRSWEVD
ncbi:hypothetical protein ACHAQH_005729 [Verticillium albo-atrum]